MFFFFLRKLFFRSLENCVREMVRCFMKTLGPFKNQPEWENWTCHHKKAVILWYWKLFHPFFWVTNLNFPPVKVVQSLLESPDVPQNKGVMELQVEGNVDPHGHTQIYPPWNWQFAPENRGFAGSQDHFWGRTVSFRECKGISKLIQLLANQPKPLEITYTHLKTNMTLENPHFQ